MSKADLIKFIITCVALLSTIALQIYVFISVRKTDKLQTKYWQSKLAEEELEREIKLNKMLRDLKASMNEAIKDIEKNQDDVKVVKKSTSKVKKVNNDKKKNAITDK